MGYREVLGKVGGLQRGFTSGTCALATAKGALLALLDYLEQKDSLLIPARRGEDLFVSVELKGGLLLSLPLKELSLETGPSPIARATILKDSGDDDDITNGHEFCATLRLSPLQGIHIEGGLGVGRVTRPGLPVPVGEWAINPGPRRMIEANLSPYLSRLPKGMGIQVTLSVPKGVELARQTWNPRLGIEGGISIIGTRGIIEPRSQAAYKASIALSCKTLFAQGKRTLYLAPGYVGEAYFKGTLDLEEEDIVSFGDHAGFALLQGASRGFDRVYFACHVGKLAKVAAGLFDTHCKSGDARLETLAALAAAAGADQKTVLELLDMKMAEEGASLLREKGLDKTFDLMAIRSAMRIKKLWSKDYDTLPELCIAVLNLEARCLNSNKETLL